MINRALVNLTCSGGSMLATFWLSIQHLEEGLKLTAMVGTAMSTLGFGIVGLAAGVRAIREWKEHSK